LNLVAKRESRDLPSWSSVPLQSSELRLHPLAPSPARPLQEGAGSFQSLRVCLSWGSCSHGHFLRRVPLLLPPRSSSRRLVWGEGRQTLAGAVLRVLAPLDGSGWLAARSESLGLRRSPWPPTLRGLLSCRSRPWSVPPELSLPGKPYPLSRASCSLAGSRSTAAGAVPAGASRSLFLSRQLVRRSNPPGGGPVTHEPGRRVPAIASPVASARSVSVPHVPSPSYLHWARR